MIKENNYQVYHRVVLRRVRFSRLMSCVESLVSVVFVYGCFGCLSGFGVSNVFEKLESTQTIQIIINKISNRFCGFFCHVYVSNRK